MSSFQPEKTHKTCKETRMAATQAEKEISEKYPNDAHLLDSLDKYLKSAIINIFKELKKAVSKKLKEWEQCLTQIGEYKEKLLKSSK